MGLVAGIVVGFLVFALAMTLALWWHRSGLRKNPPTAVPQQSKRAVTGEILPVQHEVLELPVFFGSLAKSGSLYTCMLCSAELAQLVQLQLALFHHTRTDGVLARGQNPFLSEKTVHFQKWGAVLAIFIYETNSGPTGVELKQFSMLWRSRRKWYLG